MTLLKCQKIQILVSFAVTYSSVTDGSGALLTSVPLCSTPPWSASDSPALHLFLGLLQFSGENIDSSPLIPGEWIIGHSKSRLITKKRLGPGKFVPEIFYNVLSKVIKSNQKTNKQKTFKTLKYPTQQKVELTTEKYSLFNVGDFTLIIHIELPYLTSLFLPVTNSLQRHRYGVWDSKKQVSF